MSNVYGVKHKVKYSNATFEIPMPEEETINMKPLQELGLPYTAVYLKIAHNSIQSELAESELHFNCPHADTETAIILYGRSRSHQQKTR